MAGTKTIADRRKSKRTSAEIISRAVTTAVTKLRAVGAKTVVIADMTENLLAQPNWITDEQRRNTAEIAALTMGTALRASKGLLQQVNVWCWDPRNADFYLRELKRL